MLSVEITMCIRATIAAVLGGAIGFQRNKAGSTAGMRTFAMVALGACIFGLTELIPNTEQSMRVAAQVVSGIGFLGAGVVMHSEDHIHGLTTAASMWTCAAIGVMVAHGMHIASIGFTVLMLIVLSLPKVRKPQQGG